MARIPRVYVLPLESECLEGCRFCVDAGCRNPVTRDDASIERALSRAVSGEFGAVLFPGAACRRADFLKWVDRIRELGMEPLLRVDLRLDDTLDASDLRMSFLCDGTESDRLPGLDPDRIYELCLIPSSFRSAFDFVRAAPEALRSRIVFHFSPARFKPGEVARFLETVRSELPSFQPTPPVGHEVWDSRIPSDLCLEADLAPVLERKPYAEAPKLSLVIPAYNSAPTIRPVLDHLARQDCHRSLYELILVDDGSTDDTLETVIAWMDSETGREISIKVLHFPRSRPRSPGDDRYRAGIARNLGVKSASGPVLCFLDADIVVPESFVRRVLRNHSSHDVVQYVRHHLRNPAGRGFSHEAIHPSRDSFIFESRYWRPFFSTSDWMSIPNFWKYTCSYALSMRSSDFKEVGWFRRVFNHYGFEDTDLGYRLARAGKSFYLDPLVTYHLPPEPMRSEDSGSFDKRRRMLSKTARIFFANTLDLNAYDELRGLIEEPGWGAWAALKWMEVVDAWRDR